MYLNALLSAIYRWLNIVLSVKYFWVALVDNLIWCR